VPLASKALSYLDPRVRKNPLVVDRVSSTKKVPIKKLKNSKNGTSLWEKVSRVAKDYIPDVAEDIIEGVIDHLPLILETAASFI
jgi:hypothetical protein